MANTPYPSAPDFSAPPAPVPGGTGLEAAIAQAPAAMSNGLMQVMTGTQLAAAERKEAQATQAQPHITGIAHHIRRAWEASKRAKREPEDRMMRNLRARSGIYEAAKLEEIRRTGGSEIYMMLTATKCRAAGALLRDLLMGTGSDKPWTINATAVPDLPPDVMMQAKQEATEAVMQLYMQGPPPAPQQVQDIATQIKERFENAMREEAKAAVERMENKMEDQLQEGGFVNALSEFIDDLAVYPSAILKGPVIRKKHKLTYVGGSGPSSVQVTEELVKEWERVDPARFYPAPHAAKIEDGYMIEHHSLTIEALNELKGVDGYDDKAIDMVVEDFGRGGLKEWLTIDAQMAQVREQNSTINDSPEAIIDALQYWGSVNGQMLRDWGMTEQDVPDTKKMYWVEAWLIGGVVIKAVLNQDPLGQKPYYMTSYEKVPGKFWGNSPADLIADLQNICNATARALVNNMSIASGPQVWIDVSRLPPGEDIEAMYPWKIWQVDRDAASGAGAPMGFFQPETHAIELMTVYEKFAMLADEYSGIPRYMTGAEGTPGAGRTASGLSMMIGNAAKTIKQVVSNVDVGILEPLLKQLYFHNLRFSDDPDLIGDVNIVARGALSLQIKDSAALNRNQFLQVTGNPIDMQIVGINGRAAILREQAKTLGINPDEVIPPLAELKRKQQVAEFMQMQAMMQQQQAALGQQGAPGQQQPQVPEGETLQDGTPTTDNFSPR